MANIDIEAPGADLQELAAALQALQPPRHQLVTVAAGNSITAAAKHQTDRWNSVSDIQWANIFGGAPMEFRRMAASTRMDQFGVYGYSSQTLDTINGDIEAQWFTPIADAGVIPDLAIGHALLENDLIASVSVANMQLRVNRWIRDVQTRWPGVIIMLNTPAAHGGVSGSYVDADFTAISDWMLSLDNAVNIFVCDMRVANNPTTPSMPVVMTAVGSISGTTLTITEAGSEPIRPGTQIRGTGVTASTYVTQVPGTGTGGVGTYTVSSSQTVASTTITFDLYGDGGPHPNGRLCMLRGRAMAATLGRITALWKVPYRHFSTNAALAGTGAVAGTNNTGTKPTSSTLANSVSATVSLAEQPGHLITIGPVATATPANNGFIDYGSTALVGAEEVYSFMEVEIVSGAENIRALESHPRVNDGGGNSFQYGILDQGQSVEGDYLDGDILTMRYGPFKANSGFITVLTNYFSIKPKAFQTGTGLFSFRLRKQGVGIAKYHNLIPLTAATLSVTKLYANKTTLIDRAAGVTITLPASTGNGDKYRFAVKTTLAGSGIIKAANPTDVFRGSVDILDNDAAAQGAYSASGTDDTLTMNGTTAGGLAGDYVEFEDYALGFWRVNGMLVVPAGSNPIDIFSATV